MGKKFVLINLREFGKIIMSSSLWVNKITYSSGFWSQKSNLRWSGQLNITNIKVIDNTKKRNVHE